MILGEICEDFTDEELDEVILEVRFHHNLFTIILLVHIMHFQVDLDKSTTIDFNEFVKIMTL